MRYSLGDYSRTAAQKGWGRGWPTCDASKQVARVTAPISGVSLVVHKSIARLVYLGVAEMERRGYLLRAGQCWGGNCRAIAGTQSPSNHSWWLAVDFNSLANAYVKKIGGRPVTDMPAWVPLLWNSLGFAWGGDYDGSRADAMHFEFMGSPADAKDMTAAAEARLAPQLDGAWVITDLLPPALTAEQIEENELMGAAQAITDQIAAFRNEIVGRADINHYIVTEKLKRLPVLLAFQSSPDIEVNGRRGTGEGALATGGYWEPIESAAHLDMYVAHGVCGPILPVSWNVYEHYRDLFGKAPKGTPVTALLSDADAQAITDQVLADVARFQDDIAAKIAALPTAVNDEDDRRDRDGDPGTGVVPVGS